MITSILYYVHVYTALTLVRSLQLSRFWWTFTCVPYLLGKLISIVSHCIYIHAYTINFSKKSWQYDLCFFVCVKWTLWNDLYTVWLVHAHSTCWPYTNTSPSKFIRWKLHQLYSQIILPQIFHTITIYVIIYMYVFVFRGYEVQFLPVNNSPLDNNGFPVFLQGTTEPFNNDIPLAEVAATVNKPIGFCYRYSGGKGHSLNTLPQFITVDGEDLLNNTLKIGSSYIIITIAYTQMVRTFM